MDARELPCSVDLQKINEAAAKYPAYAARAQASDGLGRNSQRGGDGLRRTLLVDGDSSTELKGTERVHGIGPNLLKQGRKEEYMKQCGVRATTATPCDGPFAERGRWPREGAEAAS